MPELASFFFVGFVLSLSANIANYIFSVKAFNRPDVLALQRNLGKIDRFWSFTNRAVAEVGESFGFERTLKRDQRVAARSVVLFGALLTAMSWLGLAGLGLYVFSVNVLAKSRMEHKIFDSPLVRQELSKEEVSKIIKDFEMS